MEKTFNCNENDSGIEVNIVKWALPREKIPLHIKFNKEIQFDKIIVHLPRDFELVEVINVKDYKIEDNGDIIISSIKKAKAPCGIFCGLVIRYTKIPDHLKFSKKILVDIIKNNQKIHSLDMECRIFRPLLKVKNAPKIIELSDKKKSSTIPLELQYLGFGDIQISIEGLIGGNIVSIGDSLMYELILRFYERAYEKGLINYEKGEYEFLADKKDKKGDLQIKPSFVKEVADDLEKMVCEGEKPPEVLNGESFESLKEYLSELKKRENFTDIIFGEVNTLLMSILKDVLERNPEDNIELKNSRTRIKTKINTPIEKIQLKVNYTDLLKNEYAPSSVTIKVDDKLTVHKDTLIEIPIKIGKIDNRPLLNVKDISM